MFASEAGALIAAFYNVFAKDGTVTQPMLDFVHFRGREHVLSNAQRLWSLAEESGQIGALTLLEHMLSVPYFKDKIPNLILLLDENGEPYGGAFLLEYRVLGVPSRIFVPVDNDGELTVLAPLQHRRDVARRVAEYLLWNGANAVLLTVSEVQSFPACLDDERGLAAKSTRELRRTLALQPTLDATLSTLGVRSRRNLRYFSRRAEGELGAAFIANAEITEAEFVALDRNCLYTVPEWVATWRYHSIRQVRGGFLSGLRAGDGSWLSLIGGHRHGLITTIDWQMNRRDIPSYSIGTAMRMFQLKAEIDSGIKYLRFEGGTPHSIQTAFLKEQVDDLLWTRGVWSVTVLQLVCKILRKRNLFSTMVVTKLRRNAMNQSSNAKNFRL
jgi:hypothetical protein